jgi:cystathionine beta-synthase
MYYQNILELIGNTPIVELHSFQQNAARIFLKLENQNPGGSIKDRIGLSMIEHAEKHGLIRPGFTLIEATAGNTGLGLALVAAQKGYKLILVIPDKMSQEKVLHLKALGTEIVNTRSDVEKGHPEYYQDLALRLSKEIPNSYYVNQFDNPFNPLAHELTTAPEIWEQMAHEVDAIVVGIGSAGTIAGLARYFKKVKPDIEIVLADPRGSILADYVESGTYGKAGSWAVEGIGEDFVPIQSDFSLVKKAYTISDEESFATARALLRQEGILAGSSTGTLLSAAVKFASQQTTPKKIVTFACDSGNKYLSKMYNDHWMIEQGFIRRETYGDLRDLIFRKNLSKEIISIATTDSLLMAYSKMKFNNISQIPVMEQQQIVGILDEYDLLLSLTDGDEAKFSAAVKDYMTSELITFPPNERIETIVPILQRGLVVIVKDETHFYGLITKIDFLNYLRLKTKEDGRLL